MSDNREDTLRQFCDVTGADETRSRFFLDSSNWQLEVALSSFYEHGGSADGGSADESAFPRPITVPLSDSDMESPQGSPLAQKKEKKKPPSNTRFATLNTLQQQDSSSDDDDETEKKTKLRLQKYFNDIKASYTKCNPHKMEENVEEIPKEENMEEQNERLKRTIERLEKENCDMRSEIAALKNESNTAGQAFYAGGSERSGQQILGPPGKSKKDIVTEMFKSARERGAVLFEDEPSTASRGRGAFSGTGYRLGQTPDDHEPVSAAGNQQAEESEPRTVRLCLYREGFTVNEGAIRHYTDPENAQFLACIRQGEIPLELSGEGGEVRVSLEDRRHEQCRPADKPHSAFSGKGHMLGSPTPPTVGATAPVAAAAADREANQRAAQDALGVDEKEPVTTVQIRLADGSRLTGRFNHTHTVGDLQQYVSRAEPSYQLLHFTLLTSFPSTPLLDPKVTLKEANLLNSTVLQRLK